MGGFWEAKTVLRRLKTASRRPKTRPRRPKMVPRCVQDGARAAIGGHVEPRWFRKAQERENVEKAMAPEGAGKQKP